MISAVIRSSKVSGHLTAPSSKSMMQRALAAALIRKGTTILHRPGRSNDDLAALNIIQSLGATAETDNDILRIKSDGIIPQSGVLHCGESGLSFRLFAALAAVSDKEIILEGEGSLLNRPMDFMDKVFPQLGIEVSSNNGKLPVKIKGPLQPQDLEVQADLSSQFLTGLLFAYAAAGASGVTIQVHELKSRPYIDLTLQVLKDFGLPSPINDSYASFHFPINPTTTYVQPYIQYTVEGDWSNAAFLLVAGALCGDVCIKGLDVFSYQGDRQILQVLMQAGAVMSIETEQVQVRKGKLQAFHYNATDTPDLFPPLVALATGCEGTSVIEGVHRLVYKESDRAKVLIKEFQKMGIEIRVQDDLMLIQGGTLKGATIDAHGDHRIAMACAVAALNAQGESRVLGANAVEKSYPEFWQDLQKLGADVSL